MNLAEHENYYLVEGVFPEHIVCGFTKGHIPGICPQQDFPALKDDLPKAQTCASMNQSHSADVCVTEEPGVYSSDALFSSARGMMLLVKTADCLPLFFYDSSRDRVGVVHLGWRPAHKGILDNLDLQMQDTVVAAGVGLRKCCYEVGGEFRHYNSINPFIQGRELSLFFDPIAFVKYQLVRLGLRFGRLHDVGICSYCSDGFPSFRRDHTDRRTLSFIMKQ